MEQNKKTIISDTNILLHYPPIDQIDWHGWCKCKLVKIVICLKVIDELDLKKDDPFLGNRAEKTIKMIKEISSKGGQIKNDVLEIYIGVSNNTIISADEVIIQQALDYKSTHNGEDVCIMTEDLGMVLRCKERIKAIEPNKDQRLQSPKSELHKENTILKSQLTKLQNQIPALSMILTQSQEGIPDSAEPFKVTTFNKICYEEEDAVIREELGGSDIRDETQRMSLLSAGILMPDYNEYRRQLSNWVKEYNKALGELSMSFNFNLYIKNTGGAPANNVEISLTFPKIFKLIYCENEHYGKEPILPEKPELPRSGLAAMVNYNDINKRIMYDPVLLQNINNDPWIKFSDNADSILLELDIKKVTHHSCSPFECVASLLSLENAHTFELEYTIIADNMPQKVNGKIPVIFELT